MNRHLFPPDSLRRYVPDRHALRYGRDRRGTVVYVTGPDGLIVLGVGPDLTTACRVALWRALGGMTASGQTTRRAE